MIPRLPLRAIDQAVYSLSNLLLLLIAARTATTAQFGALSAVLVSVSVAVGIARGSLGSVIGLSAAQGLDEVKRTGSYSLALVLVFSPVAWAAAAVMLWFVAGSTSLALLMSLGLVLPVVVAQDLSRFVASATERPSWSLLSDFIWVSVFLIAVYSFRVVGWTTTTLGLLLAWLIGAGFASVTLMASERVLPRFAGIRSWVANRRSHLVFSSLAPAASQITSWAWTGAVGGIAGASSLGAISAAILLFSPLNLLTSLLLFALMPSLAAKGVRGRVLLVRYARYGCLIALAALIWGASMLILPYSWGTSILGESWGPAFSLIPATAMLSASVALIAAASAAFLATARGRDLLFVSLTIGIVNASLAVVLALSGAGVDELAWTQALVMALGACCSWSVLWFGQRTRGRVLSI